MICTGTILTVVAAVPVAEGVDAAGVDAAATKGSQTIF